MSATETRKKPSPPQIVKLDNALKLAELWVNSMSGSSDETTDVVDTDGRPPRLGLGAKVPRHSKPVPSDDPVDRKLYGKLEAEKRKTAKITEESSVVASNGLDDDEEEEDGLESRTNAFAKRKAPVPLTSSIQGNKKQKK